METIPGLSTLRREGYLVLPDLRFPTVPTVGRKKPSKKFKVKLDIEHEGWAEFKPYAEAYMERPVKSGLTELITTFPTDATEREGSQLWHRDGHAGSKCIRAFIYLTDVDENNGPLCYAPGTQFGGYNDPNTFANNFLDCPVADWVTFTGPKGTTILFDILGFHRGLKNISGERKVLCFTYYAG